MTEHEPFDSEELRALLDKCEISDRHDKEKWRMWLDKRDNCLFLHIEGNCMAIEEGHFLKAINRAFELYPTKRAIIDLSKCTYLSSQSLGVLVTFFKASQESQGQVLLLSPPEKV